MHDFRVLEFILISLALRGIVLTFIESIGNPLEDFNYNAIFAKYTSVINYVRYREWVQPFEVVKMFEDIGYWKVFFCGYCTNMWLSVPLFCYYLNQSNLKTALIMIGVNLLIINKIK